MKTPQISCQPWLSVILVLLFALPVSAKQEEKLPVMIETLAVMPFAATEKAFDKEHAIKDMVDCKILGLCSWEKADDGSKAITDQFHLQLVKKMKHKVIPWEQVAEAFGNMPPDPHETLRSAARKFGKQLKASHVLTGTVWKYRQRVGSHLSASEPASVGFTAILVRISDGFIVWSKPFVKTQTPLTRNLLDAPLFFKKGMRWMSAEELASFGVEEILRTFPSN